VREVQVGLYIVRGYVSVKVLDSVQKTDEEIEFFFLVVNLGFLS
jgi:hypothetical protein